MSRRPDPVVQTSVSVFISKWLVSSGSDLGKRRACETIQSVVAGGWGWTLQSCPAPSVRAAALPAEQQCGVHTDHTTMASSNTITAAFVIADASVGNRNTLMGDIESEP